MRRSAHRLIGFGILILALALYVADQLFAPGAAPEGGIVGGSGVVDGLLRTIFTDIDLTPVLVALTVLGILYLLLSELIANLLSDRVQTSFRRIEHSVDRGFASISSSLQKGVTHIEKDVVMSWISNRNGSPDDFREIGLAALKAHYGERAAANGSYLDFLVRGFMDSALPEEAVHREDYRVRVNLCPFDGLLKWQEVQRDRLVAGRVPMEHPLLVSSRFTVHEGDVLDRLRRCECRMVVDGRTLVDIADLVHEPALTLADLKRGIYARDRGVTITYEDGELAIRVERTLPLATPVTEVSLQETSFLDARETGYALGLPHLVRNLDFSIALEGRAIEQVTVGPSFYHPKAANRVDVGGWPEQRHALSVDVGGWVLPGVALALVWSSPPAASARANGTTRIADDRPTVHPGTALIPDPRPHPAVTHAKIDI